MGRESRVSKVRLNKSDGYGYVTTAKEIIEKAKASERMLRAGLVLPNVRIVRPGDDS